MFVIWSHQIPPDTSPRGGKLRQHREHRLDELKVVEGENLLDCDLFILISVSSLNKIFQKVAHQCKLLCG